MIGGLAEAGSLVQTASEEETLAVGESLHAVLPKDAILLLFGDMGSGKTALVKGLGEAMGIAPELIQSPTFTLVHEYMGDQGLLVHIDLYRLDGDQVLDLGLDELLAREGRKVIEWSERLVPEIAPVGEDVVMLELTSLGGDRRRISRLGRLPA